MPIPSEFQLFGTTYKVEQPNKVMHKGESVLGRCDPDNQLIQLRRNLKKDNKELVYYHELVHLILITLEYTKLGYSEVFVERLSKALHQVSITSKYE